jgi:hypothetical protein
MHKVTWEMYTRVRARPTRYGRSSLNWKIVFRKMDYARTKLRLFALGLGQNNEAIIGLQKALDSRSRGLLFLKVDPPLDPLRSDPLRSDPRFEQLMRRVGLQPL